MQVVRSEIAGNVTEANAKVSEWKRKYPKVTKVKHKTDKKKQQESPGRYGPYWYEINAYE
jgi:hypothetical protein